MERHPVIALDLMRTLAAIAVVLVHVCASAFVVFGELPADQQTLPAAIFFGLTRGGREPVLAFFVLSGFLVGGQIVRRVRDGRFDLGAYALDRSTRIWLPLIPACLLTVAVDRLAFGLRPDWFQAVMNMIGLNGVVVAVLPANEPLWTIAYEIWFYILAGAAGYLLSGGRPSLAAFLTLAAASCVFSVLEARFLLFWCLGAMSVLLLGVRAKAPLFALGALLIAIGSPAYQLAARSTAFRNVVLMPIPLAEAFICIGICATLPLLCDPRVNARLAPLAGIAARLSGLSYTLYLVHYPVNEALALWLPKATTLSAGAFADFALRLAAIMLATLAFHWAFESRTDAARNFLRGRLLARRPAATPDRDALAGP